MQQRSRGLSEFPSKSNKTTGVKDVPAHNQLKQFSHGGAGVGAQKTNTFHAHYEGGARSMSDRKPDSLTLSLPEKIVKLMLFPSELS